MVEQDIKQDQEQGNKDIVEQDNKEKQEQDNRDMMDGEAWSETHQERKQIIIVCKDERDWINPETGKSYSDFNMCDINMIISKIIHNFKDSVIVLDDMGDKSNKFVAYYFTEGRRCKNQMIVMCHTPPQINNLARMCCDTIYIKTYNGGDLFKNFNLTYNSNQDFHGIINDLYRSHYNCTDGLADEFRYGMIEYNRKEKTYIIMIEIEL